MKEISDEQLEELGQIADRIDNLCGAMQLPMSPVIHVQQLALALPEISKQIKSLVVALDNYDPWSDE